MRRVSTRLPVLNSLLCLSDPTRSRKPEDIPDASHGRFVWATPACIIITCQPDCDGATSIVLGPVDDVPQAGALVFDGWLETPGKTVTIETVLAEPILAADVSSSTTRVRVWTTGAACSNFVTVGLN